MRLRLISKDEATRRGLFIGHEIPWGEEVEATDGGPGKNWLCVRLPVVGLLHISRDVFENPPTSSQFLIAAINSWLAEHAKHCFDCWGKGGHLVPRCEAFAAGERFRMFIGTAEYAKKECAEGRHRRRPDGPNLCVFCGVEVPAQ